MPPPQPSEESGIPTQRITRTYVRNRRSTAPSPPSSRSASPDSSPLSSAPPSRNPSPSAPIYGKRRNRESVSDDDRTPKHSRVNSPVSDAPVTASPLNDTKPKNILFKVSSSVKDEGSPIPNPHEPTSYLAKMHESFKKFGVSKSSDKTSHTAPSPSPQPSNIEWSSTITHLSDYSLSPSPAPKNERATSHGMDIETEPEWPSIHELHRHKSESPLNHSPNVYLELMRRAGILAGEKVNSSMDYITSAGCFGVLFESLGDLCELIVDNPSEFTQVQLQERFELNELIRKFSSQLADRILKCSKTYAEKSAEQGLPRVDVAPHNSNFEDSPITLKDLVTFMRGNFDYVNSRLDRIEKETARPKFTGSWDASYPEEDPVLQQNTDYWNDMSPDEVMRVSMAGPEDYTQTTETTSLTTAPTPTPKTKSTLKPASEYPVPNRPKSNTLFKPLSELPKPVAPSDGKGIRDSAHAPKAPVETNQSVSTPNTNTPKGKAKYTPVPVTSVFTPAPSYKAVTTNNKPSAPIKVDGNKLTKALANVPNTDARFIINLKNVQTGVNAFAPERTIANLIRPALAKAQRLKFRSVKWNRTGNLIFSFVHGAMFSDFLSIVPFIKKALLIPETAQVYEDVPWSKVVVARVPTGLDDNGQGERFTNDDLLTELTSCNPHVENLNIVMQPRWITKPENMSKPESSFIFAFKDPDGSILPKFLKFNTCMFGKSTPTDVMRDQPLLKECDRCLALDHDKSSCKGAYRCNLCAGGHSTSNHNKKCKACIDTDVPLQDRCPHPLKCANCQGVHKASDPLCPKRAAYKKPLKKGRTAQVIREHLANPIPVNETSQPIPSGEDASTVHAPAIAIAAIPTPSNDGNVEHTPHTSPSNTAIELADEAQIIDETMETVSHE
ncbi:peptidoglycan-binding domain-containing protein [Ceratobasidium sp. AG-Ba]|nr:peptidoglycan-binding domain-containing protein [Ceratobasidium sp. AG-Ba]